MKKTGFYLFILLTTAFITTALRPVPTPTDDNLVTVSAIVTEVREGEGENDVILELLADPNTYYINRGLEKGVAISKLKGLIKNKEVELQYINHWTSLSPSTKVRSVVRITYQGWVLYSQLGC